MRSELKFPYPSRPDLHRMIIARLFKRGFYKQFRDREVHSIYFSNALHYPINAHKSDHYSRSKLRLRWYDNGHEGAWLELKQREGNYGSKVRKKFHNNIENIQDLSFEKLVDCVSASLDACLRKEYQGYVPLFRVSYIREYFKEISSGIRVTLDKEIKYQVLGRNSSSGYLREKDNILEMKLNPQQFSKARQIDLLSGLGLWQMRSSKFMNAAEHFGFVVR